MLYFKHNSLNKNGTGMGHGHGPQNVREISIIDLNPGEHKYVKKTIDLDILGCFA